MKSPRKVFRFLIVGVINTAIDFGLLFLLTGATVPLVLANTVSTAVALGFSFIVNRKYTFQSNTNANTGKTAVKFLAVTLVGLWVLQPMVILLCLPLASSFVPDSAALLISKLVATGVSMTWNYVLYDRVVFTPKGRN